MKLTPKLILEGTRLTHKTDLAFVLNEHPELVGDRKYRYHSPLVSGEWCGFTEAPWGRGIINFEPEELDRALSTYDAWLNLMEHLPYYSWIIDRFHLSTLAHQVREGSLNDEDLDHLERALAGIEMRLDSLGFGLVLCHRDPGSFEQAREARLPVSGNPSQYDDLSVFIQEQKTMLRLAEKSILPTLVLDVSHDDVEAMANRVADWMNEIGALYPPTKRDW